MSVVQEVIVLKRQGNLNYEQRLRLKEKGRPQPKLNLRQSTKDRGKDINRYFKENMYLLCDWICGCEEKNAFFCYPCLLFSEDSLWAKNGVVDLKHLKEKIRKHSSSVVHMNSALGYASLGRIDIRLQLDSAYRKTVQDFNDNVSKNRYILSKIIDCIKFCGVFELALRGHDETESSENPGIFRGLIDFVSQLDIIFKEHLQNSTAFKGISKTIQNEILDSMAYILQNHIASEMEQSKFVAIQSDETTDSSNKTQMIFIFRYVSNGIVHERFWKLINPPGTTAQHLTDVILHELQTLKLNETPNKLIAQSYDGAAVMSGKLGGVQTKIKEHYPMANFIHCHAHQLNLILQKAVSQHRQIKVFFANLHSFSSFFGRSPKRTAVLDSFVKVRLPKAAPTRWYFNTRCIDTVYTYQQDLLRCIEKIIDDEEDNMTINQAVGLKGYLEDEIFLYWLNFFHLLMPHADILFQQLQNRNLDVVLVKDYINAFNINIQRTRDFVMQNQESDNSGPSTSKKARRLTKETEDPKRRIAIEICDIVLAEIRHRFQFCDHLIVSQLLHSDKFESFNKAFPHELLNIVKTSYPTVNTLRLKSELEVIYSREDFRNNVGAVSMLQLFINMGLTETFTETVMLLNILCTLPMVTVESERCFSTLKRVKTFLRNTMGQSRLSALAMLSIERTLLTKIDNFNEKVIDHFAAQKDRRIDLKYKQI